MARQIRMTGRAYPLFDIAQLILDKPERQMVRWDIIKDAAGKPAQPLFLCALDESLWLSEDEAVAHLLGRNFDMFYKAEKTATEPPTGHLHLCRPMRHERDHPGAAQLSRLPEQIAQTAHRAFRPHALRCLQGPRQNRQGRGGRQKMDRRPEHQDRIHLPQRARGPQAPQAAKRSKNTSAKPICPI